MSPLLAFHGKPELKQLLLEEIQKHRELDQIVQGTYGDEEDGKWRGCAVGCAIHSLNVRLKKDWDTSDHSLYEKELGIPERIARLEDSIFEGLTEELAKDFPLRFMEAIPVGADLSRVIAKFSAWLLVDEQQGSIRFAREVDKPVIQQVAELHRREASGESVTENEWEAARSAAWSAARSAQADKLLELLKEAPVPTPPSTDGK